MMMLLPDTHQNAMTSTDLNSGMTVRELLLRPANCNKSGSEQRQIDCMPAEKTNDDAGNKPKNARRKRTYPG